MLGLDARAARYTWTATSVVLLLMLVYLIRKTLFFFVVALLFGYLLSPLVNLLDRVLPASRTRTPALALAYFIFLGVLVGGGILIGSRVVDEANALRKQFPVLLEHWQQPSSAVPPSVNSFKAEAIERIREWISSRAGDILSSLPSAGAKFLSVAGDLVYVVIVPILGFFFLKDGREMREYFLSLFTDGPRRAMLDDLLADVHLLLAHYIRAIFLLSVATLISYSITLSLMGLTYGILLGAVAGVLEFIPMIGPFAGAVIILVVGGFSGVSIIGLLIFLGVYRVFQDYVLSPYVMGSGVELHPLAVLFGVFAGAEIAGVPGAFLSVPVLALLRVLYRWFVKIRGMRLAPARTA
jgi:predicted PurR-regulated permease PerM